MSGPGVFKARNSLGEMFLLDQVVNMSKANPPKKKLDILRLSVSKTETRGDKKWRRMFFQGCQVKMSLAGREVAKNLVQDCLGQ